MHGIERRATGTPSEWRNWPMLVACLAGVTLSSFQTYSLGVMIGPLEQEYGWSRAQISSGPLILAMLALFVVPMIGAGIDRIGPRRIALFGVTFFCASLAALSLAGPSILSWWLLWIPMAFGAMAVLPTLWTAAVNSFFDRNRGLALAIALCGSGVGGAIVPMLTNALVEDYGWRGGYIGIAAIGFVVVFPLVLLLFTSATDRRRAVDPHAAPARSLAGVSAREGFRSVRYAKLAGAAVLLSVAAAALVANAVPILVSHGFARGSAAGIAGLVGIGAIVGRLGGGYLLDRLDANRVAGIAVLAPVATAALLIALPGSATAASAGFLVMGLAIGTEVDACAYLAVRHFGLRSFGALFGAINGFMIFGNGLAPMLANHVYDVTKSYTPMLWALIPAFLLSSLLFFLLGAYPVFAEVAEG
jgi:MFS family permease